MKKTILKVTMVVLMLSLVVATPVFAGGVSTNWPAAGNPVTGITNPAKRVWGTVVTIVQILSFAAVVFAGLRYMFASADQKADIKKSLGVLAVGAILVFAATTVVQFVTKAANDILR